MKKNIFFFVLLSLSLTTPSYIKIKAFGVDQILTYIETYLQLQQPNHETQVQSFTPYQMQKLSHLKNKFLYFCKNDQKKLNNLMLRACEKGFENIALWAIENGADVKYTKNLLDQTALHLAAKSGKLKVVKLILEREDNLNSRDFWNKIPLEVAKDEANENATIFLIQKMHECNCYHCNEDLRRLSFN